MTKFNVDIFRTVQFTRLDHDVVWVSIADAEDEGGDAVPGAAECERLDGLLHRVLVVLADPLVELRRVHLESRL